MTVPYQERKRPTFSGSGTSEQKTALITLRELAPERRFFVMLRAIGSFCIHYSASVRDPAT
jgi:hypothetical protein